MNFFVVLSIVFLFSSCGGNKIVKSNINKNYEVEIVEAIGTAPIVEGNIEGAKKSSLSDALKNALHLVVGVYVSGDTLVSKSVLIDDEITSKSEGYIERYEVLKEYTEDNFYKTKIKAYVRKEDITLKLRNIESDVERIGSPVIYLNIIDADTKSISSSQDSIISDLKKDNFRISLNISDADIIIDGKSNIKFNTSEGLGGFISYGCSISGTIKSKDSEIIGSFNGSSGGIGTNDFDAKNNAGVNCGRKVYLDIRNSIIDFYNKKRIVKFEISGISSMNNIQELIKYFRNIPAIRNALVKSYDKDVAVIDLLVHKGNARDLINLIIKNTKIEILKTNSFAIYAKYK